MCCDIGGDAGHSGRVLNEAGFAKLHGGIGELIGCGRAGLQCITIRLLLGDMLFHGLHQQFRIRCLRHGQERLDVRLTDRREIPAQNLLLVHHGVAHEAHQRLRLGHLLHIGYDCRVGNRDDVQILVLVVGTQDFAGLLLWFLLLFTSLRHRWAAIVAHSTLRLQLILIVELEIFLFVHEIAVEAAKDTQFLPKGTVQMPVMTFWPCSI